jgi:hypothetical protein
LWERIERDQLENPEKYSMLDFPAVWGRLLALRFFVDTPMHLMFLGIAKTIFAFVGFWAAKSGRGPAFRKIAKALLQELDDLKLGWLTFNITTFDSWGGWISEKYHSLSRVAYLVT